MNYTDQVALQMLATKAGELNEFLQKASTQTKYWGDNVIDVAMSVITEQRVEIERLEGTISSMRSEIYHTLKTHSSEDVKRHYLERAMRCADRAIYVK